MTSKITTANVLTAMHVLAWIAFIGLCIKAGALLVSFGISCFRPIASGYLYEGLDLSGLLQFSFWHYALSSCLIIGVAALKAYLVFLVTGMLSSVNLTDPFTAGMARILEQISAVLLFIWLIGLMGRLHSHLLLKLTGQHFGTEVQGEYLFLAGLVFVISQVFRRGVELQTEHALTV